MHIFDLPLDILLYILEYMDNSYDFTHDDMLNFIMCNKEFLNLLLNRKIKFYKKCDNILNIESPFFSYDTNISPNSKKLFLENTLNLKPDMSHIKELYLIQKCDLYKYYFSEEHKLKYESNIFINMMPQSITHLTLGGQFNQNIDNLPQTITHLILGELFNQPVDKLPQNLIYLEFGHDFNKSVDNLPKNLKYLKLGNDFSRSVDYLPNNLKYLKFNRIFNRDVDKLPRNLTHLAFGRWFNRSTNKLPQNLTHLVFGERYCGTLESLPHNLKYLSFDDLSDYNNFKNLPNSLECLSTSAHIQDILKQQGYFPKTLQYLRLNTNSKEDELKKLSRNIKCVYCCDKIITRDNFEKYDKYYYDIYDDFF